MYSLHRSMRKPHKAPFTWPKCTKLNQDTCSIVGLGTIQTMYYADGYYTVDVTRSRSQLANANPTPDAYTIGLTLT